MNIFKSKTRSREDLEMDLLKSNVNQAKADETRSVFKTFLFGMLVALSVFFLVGKFIKQEPVTCDVCYQDYSQVMKDEGYVIAKNPEKTAWYVKYEGRFGIQGAEDFSKVIDKVFFLSKPGDTLLMHIESFGGAAPSCSLIYDRVRRLKAKDVHVVAMTDYLMASCGYKLATVADEIYSAKGAHVGNIGSAYRIPNKSANTTVGTTRAKELFAGSPVTSKKDILTVKMYLAMEFEHFKDLVKESRGDKIKEEHFALIFSGYPFSGQTGYDIGLVDHLADTRTVLSRYNISGHKIIRVYQN